MLIKSVRWDAGEFFEEVHDGFRDDESGRVLR